MVSFFYILLFVLASSLIGLAGGRLLLLRKKIASPISKYMISFAAGALIGAAFLDLLPEAIAQIGLESAPQYALLGILSFLLLEIFFVHHHHFYGKKTNQAHAFSYLAMFADTLHNFVDGIVIAVTFLVSLPLGLATFLAVLFHEIPQEIGDFSILWYAGMKKKKIIFYNILSGLMSVVGAAGGYFVLPQTTGIIGSFVAF